MIHVEYFEGPAPRDYDREMLVFDWEFLEDREGTELFDSVD